MTTTPSPSRAYEEAAKALFFEQCSIMHDHEENWRKANQAIWRDCAKAAIIAFLASLAKDEEPMKLMPRTMTAEMHRAMGYEMNDDFDTRVNMYGAAWDAAPVEGDL